MLCFPYEIDTILSNLISNSTASFEKVKTPEKKIYIDVKEENENIRIDYSDTGAGLDAIYKNNPEKMNEEVMKLYKEYNVNPMAGCLPLLIQMPILIGLFGALRQYDFDPIEHATFFWIPNLADKDPFYILPVLVAATMFLQQKISMAATPQAAENPTMKTMLYIMPAMMLFVCWSMPSGLCLYWAFFSILSIIQQFFMNKQKRKEMEARAAREAEEKEKRIAEKKAKMTSKKAAAGKGKQKEAVKADVVEEKEEE